MPMTTVERTWGMKKTVRKRVNPFGCRQRSMASSMPMTIGEMVPTITQVRLCLSESQSRSSCISSR